LNPDPEGEQEGEGDWFFNEDEVMSNVIGGDRANNHVDLAELLMQDPRFEDADEEESGTWSWVPTYLVWLHQVLSFARTPKWGGGDRTPFTDDLSPWNRLAEQGFVFWQCLVETHLTAYWIVKLLVLCS
jgi:hypothetical protein